MPIVVGAALWLGAAPAEAQSGVSLAEVQAALQSNTEVLALLEAGKYDAAIPLAERNLAVFERVLVPDHISMAAAVGNLAALYQAKGQYGRAEPLFKRALAIREKAQGSDHPDVARALNNLAWIYSVKGEYGRAEPLFKRALAIQARTLGLGNPDFAISLGNLADLYEKKGDYGHAEPLLQRALAVYEKALGPDDIKVARALNNLAGLHQKKGEYARAEPLFRRALAVEEKALGSDHPDLAIFLNNLALLYQATGEYTRAEPLQQRALAIEEKALGPAHPAVASSLNNLALLYQTTGEYGRAEPLFRRALAIQEKVLGPDHPEVAVSLNNLAWGYKEAKEFDRAEPLNLRALAIQEKALGPDHPDVAAALNSLATLYTAKGEYDRAKPLLQRAISIQERALGPSHPDLAAYLTNLAHTYGAAGEFGRTEEILWRALTIQEKALGPDHPAVAGSLNGLAVLHWATGRLPETIRLMTRSQDIEEKTLGRVLAAGSEAQKRAYLATFSSQLPTLITLALQTRDPGAARLALTTALRRKGRVLDATASSLSSLRARLGSDEQRLLDELDAARARYITLVLQGSTGAPLDDFRRSLVSLDEEIRARESAISARSAEFRVEQQPVTVAAVQAALPEGAALVEWLAYTPLNLGVRTDRVKQGSPRYAACILPRRGEPVWVDLGEVKTINDEVQALRSALRRPANTEVTFLARDLEASVMAPVRAVLGEARRIMLSPDGALNLIPFAALVGDDIRPLIEHYSFTYLTSGRDLLRLSVPTPTRGDPLVLAAPEFDDPDRPGGGRFFPLLRADEEAATVARLFPDTTVLLHRDATKQRLREAHGPRLLHIGTHGYFESMVCMTDPRNVNEAQTTALANPLLHSGIALAGANACERGQNEGMLTAFEASGLDLYGTKLVVLSACQTGVGDATAGDGVYGLRRALVLAGAETQVMSLWPVDGAATADLMKAYYEALARGGRRSESMRNVQLAMLHDKRWSHPYYWAGFIVSGDDRRLDENIQSPDLRVHPGGACHCTLGADPQSTSAAWLAGAALLALARRRALRLSAPRHDRS
jgi:CHAT domain-containing protein/Tfp pilus assembly protein PilF